MIRAFDSEAIAKLGWRQGSLLGANLAQLACEYDRRRTAVSDADRLFVTTHDCDIVSPNLGREPFVEVLRGRVATADKLDKQLSGGRNPRVVHLGFDIGGTDAVPYQRFDADWVSFDDDTSTTPVTVDMAS